MNDPTYIESSRKLAERILREGGASNEDRVRFAFRCVLGRLPKEKEAGILKAVFDEQLAAYRKDEKAALKLLKVGESQRDERLETAELAAWSIIASVLLNLDETVTRG
jgi:hypothetical protein